MSLGTKSDRVSDQDGSLYCSARNWAICDLYTPYGFGTFNSLQAGERADSTFCNIVFVDIFCFFLRSEILLEIRNFHRDVFSVLQVCNVQNTGAPICLKAFDVRHLYVEEQFRLENCLQYKKPAIFWTFVIPKACN